jgi:hypothetical protein
VRTLDPLHLASIEYIRSRMQFIEFASFDERLLATARPLDVSNSSLVGLANSDRCAALRRSSERLTFKSPLPGGHIGKSDDYDNHCGS